MRKVEGLSNPQLVAMRRDTYRQYAKAKLLQQPSMKTLEAYLKRCDAELAKRHITIDHPELK